MTIEYLKSLERNPRLWDTDMRGLTESRIEELETAINNGNTFPKAFREFLSLSGDYNCIGLDTGFGPDYSNGEDYVALKSYYEATMKKYGVSIDRPFVIFRSHDGLCFMFIYLDEGDDPKPYNFGVDPDYRADDGSIIYVVPNVDKFSKLIDDLVDRARNGIQPF